MTSQTQTAGHKMAALTEAFLRLSNVDFKFLHNTDRVFVVPGNREQWTGKMAAGGRWGFFFSVLFFGCRDVQLSVHTKLSHQSHRFFLLLSAPRP